MTNGMKSDCLQLMIDGEGGTKLDWTIRLSWIRDIVNGS